MVLAKGAVSGVIHIRAAVIICGVLIYKIVSPKRDAIDSAARECSVRVSRISYYRTTVAGINAVNSNGSLSIQESCISGHRAAGVGIDAIDRGSSIRTVIVDRISGYRAAPTVSRDAVNGTSRISVTVDCISGYRAANAGLDAVNGSVRTSLISVMS